MRCQSFFIYIYIRLFFCIALKGNGSTETINVNILCFLKTLNRSIPIVANTGRAHQKPTLTLSLASYFFLCSGQHIGPYYQTCKAFGSILKRIILCPHMMTR